MPSSFSFGRRTGALALATFLLVALVFPTGALALSVTINGNTVALNPPPVERNGRVFVPLRGIFERLGATVVYQSGTITATGSDGRTILLRIGSTQATVAGQTQTIDVAPFIIGASTYVPLRFIAQSLGATVNWDAANAVVAIVPSYHGAPAPPPPTAAPAASEVRLRNVQPPDDAYVQSVRPTIAADFNRRVDPNTVRIVLDGLDVTSQSTRSETGIVYAPPSPLQSGRHRVEVSGKDRDGASFTRVWRFNSGSRGPTNTITLDRPQNGDTVGRNFTVSGHSVPNARVHLEAGALAPAGPFTFTTGTYVGDTVADSNGYFSQQVSINAVSGGRIGLTVTSTDPVTKESAQVKLTLNAG
ncbi:MAG: copper amine oxidase N-terminal domain-containing protein [Candidatus Eremiobacteraeota bacterium]|nr:copper amine oxidase N-terminal domain-containing protein [Candidatus Eremiobacteraeota bacterium]MBV9646448.1 copper amine oxidase N-terminal domain-containing protein [Candidatus Eremiobacteraeota bacterium]